MTIQTFTAGQTLTAAQMNTLQASDFNFTRNVLAGTSYTMVLADKGKLLEFENTGSITLTIPTNAAAALTSATELIFCLHPLERFQLLGTLA